MNEPNSLQSDKASSGNKHMWQKLKQGLKQAWCFFRHVSGDDAYEQYLKHHAEFHANTPDATPALDRKAFFKLWQANKWQGVKRCC